ncbi:tripartite tricarboxylate transporter permease [Paenibacillus crassostreae]|uniref:Tripartite tricarboxylate transporter TctA family protein n=1 Tax=Paenibacillus crassostreae TaxID=1763538 RepID=A0A162KNL4_9BACL|nr:tripartite tricarboxylate transporter permease [Paenibacillus crassostreae]AOZ93679.1 tripartite tricarboxylate transporter TctA family protein [Paenibacillus crassostreae]OAB71373.1 tripartite tricarboxylate transporter TctA family protein [Paenibacillus crassostreae]
MDISLFIQMVVAAIVAVVLYTFIGFVPGTDETSVLMPITLAIILAGTEPIVVLTFFISAVITLNLTNAMPTALVGLPGGVMSSPMIEHALYLKNRGLSTITIKKMAAGSLIGTVISIPVALLLANLLTPFATTIKPYAPLLFVIGAVFLSLIGKHKILALFSIIPLAMLFQSLRHLYWGTGVVAEGSNITTSFFLGITIGPLVISLFSLLNKQTRAGMLTDKLKNITIPNDLNAERTLNPFKILSRQELKSASLASLVSNFIFVLSPVGLVILFGEAVAKRKKDPVEKASTAITTMSALAHSTYLSGIIIPLIALGIPLSPTAIGPGGALFNAPPIFTIDHNLHHILSRGEFVWAIVVGAIISSVISYVIIIRYAGRISKFVLTRIPHEAVLGLFISFILLLAYMDAGVINIFGVLLIGITCGTLNKMGVNYGIQFMTLYAAPWIIEKLVGL